MKSVGLWAWLHCPPIFFPQGSGFIEERLCGGKEMRSSVTGNSFVVSITLSDHLLPPFKSPWRPKLFTSTRTNDGRQLLPSSQPLRRKSTRRRLSQRPHAAVFAVVSIDEVCGWTPYGMKRQRLAASGHDKSPLCALFCKFSWTVPPWNYVKTAAM